MTGSEGDGPATDSTGDVFITGAGNGIGKATALALAGRGRRLALFDIDAEAAEAVAHECRSLGASALAFGGDVREQSSVQWAVSDSLDHGYELELVACCAGVGRYAPFLEITSDEWRTMWEVNVLGTVHVAQAALPAMIARDRGHIVLLGSRRGLAPAAGTSAYSASKAALVGLSRGLEQELAESNVKVTLVQPGGTRTGFRNTPAAQKPRSWLDVSDVVDTILFVVGLGGNAVVSEVTVVPRSID